MSDDTKCQVREPEASKAAQHHCGNFEQSVAPLEKALKFLAPDGTRQQILNAFDNRTTWHTIRDWRRGKRHVAPWAIELMKTKRDALGAAIDDIKIGPGQRAGDKNLIRRYRT